MPSGTVKWFNAEKGFGFITPDDGRRTVRPLLGDRGSGGYRTLEEGQRVEFEVTQGQKGPQAANIRSPNTTHTQRRPPLRGRRVLRSVQSGKRAGRYAGFCPHCACQAP